MEEIEIAAMTDAMTDAGVKMYQPARASEQYPVIAPAYHAYVVVVRRTERTVCRVFATDVDGARSAFGKMYGRGQSAHTLATGFRFIRTLDKR